MPKASEMLVVVMLEEVVVVVVLVPLVELVESLGWGLACHKAEGMQIGLLVRITLLSHCEKES